MNEEEKRERLDELWNEVKLYSVEIMLQARFKKLEEQTMKDNTFEFEEDHHEEIEKEEDEDYQPKWYLIEKNGKPCQFWDFMITCIIIYNLFVTPFILVFPDVYQTKNYEKDTYESTTDKQKQMQSIEIVFDIVYTLDILLNFVKRTRGHKTITQISTNYMYNFFIFDVISVIPLFNSAGSENFSLYYLKVFKIARVDRIAIPHRLLLEIAL